MNLRVIHIGLQRVLSPTSGQPLHHRLASDGKHSSDEMQVEVSDFNLILCSRRASLALVLLPRFTPRPFQRNHHAYRQEYPEVSLPLAASNAKSAK